MWRYFPSIPTRKLDSCLLKTADEFDIDREDVEKYLKEELLVEQVKKYPKCFLKYKPVRMLTSDKVWVYLNKRNYQLKILDGDKGFADLEFQYSKMMYKHNIGPKVIDLVKCNGRYGLVTELLDGDLRDLLLSGLSDVQLKKILLRILTLIKRLYIDLKISHGYLVVENIGFKVTEGGNYKIFLTDWSVAEKIDSSEDVLDLFELAKLDLHDSIIEFVDKHVNRKEHDRIRTIVANEFR